MKRLSAMAGVSLVTMWKAVQALRKDGKVTVRRGGRIIAGNATEQPENSVQEAATTSERKRILIERDIITRIYAPGDTLPSIGKLSVQYGGSYYSIRKVLAALVKDKVLVPYKRTFRVPGLRSRQYQSSIAIFSSGDIANAVAGGSQRTKELIQSLENECANANIRVLCFGFDYFDSTTMARLRDFLRSNDSIIGSILMVGDWFLYAKDIEGIRWLNSLVSEIGLERKPIAVFDEMGDFELTGALAIRPEVRLFRISAKSAGQAMARMLIQLGHTHVAYLSWQHRYVWSQRRLRGIIDQYSKAGLAGNVFECTCSNLAAQYDLGWAASGMSVEEVRKINRKYGGMTPEGLENFLSYYHSFSSAGLFPDPDHPLLAACRKNFALLKELYARDTELAFFDSIHSALLTTSARLAFDIYLQPLFERALADSRITAWIAANDQTALHAIRYLRTVKKIPVPGAISVAGFDDTAESLEQKLTTYTFNMPAITHTMLAFLLGPRPHGKHVHAHPSEIEGVIIQRETCARADKGG
jgi:DNA-binding transcriptional regulator YhcF (GntR family)